MNEALAPPEEAWEAPLVPLAVLLALVVVATLAWVVLELAAALAA